MMGSLSPTAMRGIGRVGVPIVAALAAVLVSTQGASAAPRPSHSAVPAPPCVQHVVTGSPVPRVSQSGEGNGGVVVTRPAPGKPGMPTCVVCGAQAKPGSGHAVPMRPGACVICVVHIKTGGAHGGTGQVTGGISSSGPVTTGAGGSGPVTVGSGHGGGVVSGPGPSCPPLPPIHSGSSR